MWIPFVIYQPWFFFWGGGICFLLMFFFCLFFLPHGNAVNINVCSFFWNLTLLLRRCKHAKSCLPWSAKRLSLYQLLNELLIEYEDKIFFVWCVFISFMVCMFVVVISDSIIIAYLHFASVSFGCLIAHLVVIKDRLGAYRESWGRSKAAWKLKPAERKRYLSIRAISAEWINLKGAFFKKVCQIDQPIDGTLTRSYHMCWKSELENEF